MTDYEKAARDLFKQLGLLTDDDGVGVAAVAQAIECADISGRIEANLSSAKVHCLFCYSLWPLDPDTGEDDYRHIKPGETILKRCDSQYEQRELATLHKRLEELGK